MTRVIPTGFTYDDKRAAICKYYDKLAITVFTQELGWTYVIDSTKSPMQPRTFESLDEVMDFIESCEYVKFEEGEE